MTPYVYRLPLQVLSLVFAALLLAASGFAKVPAASKSAAKAKLSHKAPVKTKTKAVQTTKPKTAAPTSVPPATAQTPPPPVPAPTPAAPDPAAQTAALVTAGKVVYDTNGCAGCHTGGKAPDLSHEGARHTAEQLASYVKNPQQWDAGSRMPAFGNKISDKDLQTLGVYLASLK